MSLITRQQFRALLANGRAGLEARQQGHGFDPHPIVKLRSQDEWPLWLLAEIDPVDHDHAFGICDLGTDPPRLTTVSLTALAGLREFVGIDVRPERDFAADRALSEYLEALSVHHPIIR